jgi:hypothetical protein
LRWRFTPGVASSFAAVNNRAMGAAIDLSDEELCALDAWRELHGVSRAEAIRRAIARLIEGEDRQGEALASTRGLWAKRDEDAVAYQTRLRSEWEQ